MGKAEGGGRRPLIVPAIISCRGCAQGLPAGVLDRAPITRMMHFVSHKYMYNLEIIYKYIYTVVTV